MFNRVHTAYEYKMSPSEFFALSSSDKAMMMTYTSIISKMKAATTKTEKKKLGKDG